MWDEIYARHYPELMCYATGVCHDQQLAEDIAQEVFVRALQNADTFEDLSPSQQRSVKCDAELEDALAMICHDVVQLNACGNEDSTGIGDMVKGALGIAKDALNTKMINAGDYVL